ncbi:MAG: YncE family protein [Chloroflexi bacterium]|nr:YncE family protein [Chloroflexota bacterium]
MSEPRTDRSVGQALTAWMDDVAPDRVPTRLLEETFARTMKTGQARRYPWHELGIGGLGRPFADRSTRTAVLVLVALLIAALALGLGVGGFGRGLPAVPSPSPTPEPIAGALGTRAPLPPSVAVTPRAVIPAQGPIAIVSVDSAIWILRAGELDRIDTATNLVTGSVTLGGAADLYNDLAANDAGLWATDWDTALLYRVDPTTLKVVARIPAGLAPKGILASSAGVWVADTHDGKVLRIDPATNTVVARIVVGPTGSSGPNWLASGLGSIWVDVPNNATVVRISPASDAIQASIQIPPSVVPCGGFQFESTVVWVITCGGASGMAGIDPTTNTVVGSRNLGPFEGSPTLINGGQWFSMDTGDAKSGQLVRIDPATNTVDRALVPAESFGGGGGMVVDAGSVWVIDGYNNAVLRLPLAAFGP